MPVYPKSTMYEPQQGDSPWMSGLKTVARTLGWNDPNAVMGVGAPASIASDPLEAMAPQVVESATTPQAAPTSSAVDSLIGQMKGNLARVPTSAVKAPITPPAAEFAPRGGEELYNMSRQYAPKPMDPVEAAYQRILAQGGQSPAMKGLVGAR